jgi:hypothetical protein
MYLMTVGGSGLLHLLAAYPRVVAVLGVTTTVAMLMAPLGSGRYVGTAGSLAKLDRSIAARAGANAEERAVAEAAAATILERGETTEISAAVTDVLDRCGVGCTDLTSAAVAHDTALLRRVLVLHELDRAAHNRETSRNANRTSPTPRQTSQVQGTPIGE